MENLSHNQELVEFVIISFILTTTIFNPRVILLGEIRFLSLLGVKGLILVTLMCDLGVIL